jgi:hypothetical protein
MKTDNLNKSKKTGLIFLPRPASSFDNPPLAIRGVGKSDHGATRRVSSLRTRLEGSHSGDI